MGKKTKYVLKDGCTMSVGRGKPHLGGGDEVSLTDEQAMAFRDRIMTPKAYAAQQAAAEEAAALEREEAGVDEDGNDKASKPKGKGGAAKKDTDSPDAEVDPVDTSDPEKADDGKK